MYPAQFVIGSNQSLFEFLFFIFINDLLIPVSGVSKRLRREIRRVNRPDIILLEKLKKKNFKAIPLLIQQKRLIKINVCSKERNRILKCRFIFPLTTCKTILETNKYLILRFQDYYSFITECSDIYYWGNNNKNQRSISTNFTKKYF